MKIAIHNNGDWNDAEVTEATLQILLRNGDLWFSGTDTGKQYNEADPRPIYNCDEWPGWSVGFTYLPLEEAAS